MAPFLPSLPVRGSATLKTDPKDGGQIDFMISRKVKSTWRIGRGRDFAKSSLLLAAAAALSARRIVMSGSHVIPRLFGSVFFAGKFTRFAAAAAESVAPPSVNAAAVA